MANVGLGLTRWELACKHAKLGYVASNHVCIPLQWLATIVVQHSLMLHARSVSWRGQCLAIFMQLIYLVIIICDLLQIWLPSCLFVLIVHTSHFVKQVTCMKVMGKDGTNKYDCYSSSLKQFLLLLTVVIFTFSQST
jgi:hypothetical protein